MLITNVNIFSTDDQLAPRALGNAMNAVFIPVIIHGTGFVFKDDFFIRRSKSDHQSGRKSFRKRQCL